MTNWKKIQCGLVLSSLFVCGPVLAEPAVKFLKQDYVFPNKIEGFPQKLSDFKGLEIHQFRTNDGVTLSYWEAGQGKPLVFIPGWSSNGAEFINVMFLLSKQYRVIVLDPRNQGLSGKVNFGSRISRFAMDLKQLQEHLKLGQADYIGWSMGAAILWSYIDLFGTKSINKLVLIDEPIAIYTRSDWSEQERLNAGGMTTSAERMIAAFSGAPTNSQVVDMNAMTRFMAQDSVFFQNSQGLSKTVIKAEPEYAMKVMFDHITNDWRDVVQYKIDVPTAIFTGELSNNLQSQRWAQSVIPDSKLFVYSKDEEGDHFLAAKNPLKFVHDLTVFLQQKP
jgi:pimeloyl-ACP methyl ester carboxylesterase